MSYRCIYCLELYDASFELRVRRYFRNRKLLVRAWRSYVRRGFDDNYIGMRKLYKHEMAYVNPNDVEG